MTYHYPVREHRLGWILKIVLLWLTSVSSHEIVSSRHRTTPDASTLKIEAKESEASIILGKDLVLDPTLSSETLIVANSSDSGGIVTGTKHDLSAAPTITRQISTGEHAARDAVSTDTNHRRSSHTVFDNRPREGFGKKASKTVWKRDSYLEALKHSRTSDDPREGIVRTNSNAKANRREYAPVYKPQTEYGSLDVSTYPSKGPRIVYSDPGAHSPGDSYSPPFKSSVDFSEHYGAPPNVYGSPGPSFYQQTPYGPPGNSYVPSPQEYGTSIHVSPPSAIYGAPYSLSDIPHIPILPTFDLGWPLALKLNAFTIAKIVLKLVIFKMIVKFIAIICLLLFIPKLEIAKKKGNKADDDDEERSLSSPYASLETLNGLESAVKSSVEKYEELNDARSSSTTKKKCTTLACRSAEALTFRESWDDYLNLFKSYVEEERRVTTQREKQ